MVTSTASKQSTNVNSESGPSCDARQGEEEKKEDQEDGLPQVEETKEVAKNRRKKVINVDIEAAPADDDDDVTDDSFKNANLSLMPQDTAASMLAAALPETKVKAEIQPTNLKVVNRPLLPLNHV